MGSASCAVACRAQLGGCNGVLSGSFVMMIKYWNIAVLILLQVFLCKGA